MMAAIRHVAALALYVIALGAHHTAMGFAWLSDRIGDSAKWVLED